MAGCKGVVGSLLLATLAARPVMAEQLIWAIQVEQLEYRLGEDENIAAYDLDAYLGTDEMKAVWRSEGEFSTDEEEWETLENQLRLQVPVSDFFDAVGGLRLDTPEAATRVHGVVGLHGLAEQWFEVDADLFISNRPSFRFEVEYEGLITNWIVLTPSLELDVPFRDDQDLDQGAWGPKLELGLRLSYDLVDRSISPYIGGHYERVFGESASIARNEGKGAEAFFFVAGARLMF